MSPRRPFHLHRLPVYSTGHKYPLFFYTSEHDPPPGSEHKHARHLLQRTVSLRHTQEWPVGIGYLHSSTILPIASRRSSHQKPRHSLSHLTRIPYRLPQLARHLRLLASPHWPYMCRLSRLSWHCAALNQSSNRNSVRLSEIDPMRMLLLQTSVSLKSLTSHQ